MSKHNYSQYSKKKYVDNMTVADQVADVESFETIVAATDNASVTPEVKMVVETVDTVILPKTVTGFVTNCSKLNVRVNPDVTAEVVCILDSATEVVINLDNSTNEWFSICTAAGVEGFCMRKFVNAKL